MRISKTLAVAISGFAIVGAAAIPATAGAAHAAHPAGTHGTFPSTLSKHTAKPGTKLTLKAHGAEKKTSYLCIFAVVKGKAHGQNLSNTTSVTSSSKGKFSCTLTFKKFTTAINGKNVSCPPTAAEKKAGVKCGFAAADPTNSQNSNTIQYFTAKK